MELFYNVLKVLSMLAAGAFGILALLTKYKDDHGRITKWGRIAIGGILISACISLSLYALEASKANTAAMKARAEAEATKQNLEIIIANAIYTAKQQQRSLEETEILKFGLEQSLKTSQELASAMKAEREAAEERNNQLLHQVERTIHPLFPLEVRVIYRAPLADNSTSVFRQQLEAALKTSWAARKQGSFAVHPNDFFYPSPDREPLAYGIVTALIGSRIRFYTKDKTNRHDFTEDDLNFCYCPFRRFTPTYEERQDETLFGGEAASRHEKDRLSHRSITFRKDGLEFDDGTETIDLIQANANRGFMSADDLYGATIQIEVSPTVYVNQDHRPVNNDLFVLESLMINLPGNRKLWIREDQFGRSQHEDKLLYRFTFPISPAAFSKLLTNF